MAHDGQDLNLGSAILPDLLTLTAEAIAPVETVFEAALAAVRAMVMENGRVSGTLVEQNQTAAHGLAWLATYVESLRQMQHWAGQLNDEGNFGEVEQLLLQIAFGEYLWQIYGGIQMNQGEIVRLQDLGLTQDDMRALMVPAVMTLTQGANTQAARSRLVELMEERQAEVTVGRTGLDEELEMIREQFRRYAVDRIIPDAHEWHLKDELIPMEIIEELAEMGVFGLTIPEEFGGLGLSKASMCVVSEELSRGYIGV
jgi:(2S)-methylsuccinyl-CoA dehydrogenase